MTTSKQRRARKAARWARFAHDQIEKAAGTWQEHLAVYDIFECPKCQGFVPGVRAIAAATTGKHVVRLDCGHSRAVNHGWEE